MNRLLDKSIKSLNYWIIVEKESFRFNISSLASRAKLMENNFEEEYNYTLNSKVLMIELSLRTISMILWVFSRLTTTHKQISMLPLFVRFTKRIIDLQFPKNLIELETSSSTNPKKANLKEILEKISICRYNSHDFKNLNRSFIHSKKKNQSLVILIFKAKR